MTPKLGTILLLVPPVLHGNWLKEWDKSADADELTKLKVELVHIHNTADKKDAPFSYNYDKHWQAVPFAAVISSKYSAMGGRYLETKCSETAALLAAWQ